MELLLVIAILGIVAGIAVPALTGQRQRAKDIGDAKTNARVIQMALETRKAEMGVYGDKNKTTTYKADGTREGEDIIPTFTPKGNSKMDYEITIGETGLTYDIIVTDPARPSSKIKPIKFNQNGEVKEVRAVQH